MKVKKWILPLALFTVLVFLLVNTLSLPVLATDWAKCSSKGCACECEGTSCSCAASGGSCRCTCYIGKDDDCTAASIQ